MRTAALVIIAMAMAVSATAHAQSVGQASLTQAKKHWSESDFDLVVGAADKALAATTLTKAERVEALRYKGMALTVLQKKLEATKVFEALFDIAPDYELPANTSPAILAVFRPARAGWQVKVEARLATELGKAYAALRMTLQLPPRTKGGRSLALPIDVTDPKRIVDKLTLSYRRRGSRYFATQTATGKPGRTTLRIPGTFTASKTPFVLELYLRSLHRSGGILRRQGGPDRPLLIQVDAGQVPRSRPITKRWWFWPSAVALVASVIAVPILIRAASDVGPQNISVMEKP